MIYSARQLMDKAGVLNLTAEQYAAITLGIEELVALAVSSHKAEVIADRMRLQSQADALRRSGKVK